METYIKEALQKFEVKNQIIEVSSKFRFNSETDEIIFDRELDNIAINKAFDVYREQNNILSKEMIKEIRQKYTLSQRGFAKLLGWSPATVTRYEKGAIPSKVNSGILFNLSHSTELAKSLLSQHKQDFSTDEINQLENRIQELDSEIDTNDLIALIEKRFDSKPKSIESGYSKFSFEKLKQMIIYFISSMDHLSKTKLNKLLFYSDFGVFKENTVSMSGVVYIHDYYGPVPENADLIYSSLVETGTIEKMPFPNGKGERLLTGESFDKKYFNTEELMMLERVKNQFKEDRANEISEKSHQEIGYIETELKEIISYAYALNLKNI